MSFYCLANPYSGKDDEEMNLRAKAAAKAVCLLLDEGIQVLGLNPHNHFVKVENNLSKEKSRDVFLRLSPNIISKSKGLIVLTLDGWERSSGVKMEIETAKKHNLPIYYLSLKEIMDKNQKIREIT